MVVLHLASGPQTTLTPSSTSAPHATLVITMVPRYFASTLVSCLVCHLYASLMTRLGFVWIMHIKRNNHVKTPLVALLTSQSVPEQFCFAYA